MNLITVALQLFDSSCNSDEDEKPSAFDFEDTIKDLFPEAPTYKMTFLISRRNQQLVQLHYPLALLQTLQCLKMMATEGASSKMTSVQYPSLDKPTYTSTKQSKAEVNKQLRHADVHSVKVNEGLECYQKLKTEEEDAQAEKKAVKD
ncbi:hypothetical protein RHMOL_Rhmol11G0127200 [Rhododendron molle]|uniref:Uncharacterized protein n=1 Tax=Rhododendron molle TaxID=49168 RepID=A0ACC0LRF4_RHOML|nr:hypothetical protein RHMOL_Rhmol11G0127200 [Rhododendron molle]